MKIWKQHVLVTIGAVGLACSANAADSSAMNDNYSSSPLEYRAHEFSLDIFGSGSVGQQVLENISGDRVDDNGRLGLGLGVNYFFTRYLGIGSDLYSEDSGHALIDSTSISLIGRLPIGESGVAPYIFGGGGYQFDEFAQRFAHAGGGFEFRFARHSSVFIDGRFVFAANTDNYGLGRIGFRFTF
jgi:hypothetical protein